MVRTDASDTHIGAVLEQSSQLVAYILHKLSPIECNYQVADCKLLAIFLACQKWYCYLHGAESTVVHTDHKALVPLFTQPLLNPHWTHWVEKLAELHLDIQYIAGPANTVADGLS